MSLVAIRGATTISYNTEIDILSGTEELIKEIEEKNNIDKDLVISILFTCTKDINQAYPARAARGLGYTNAGLMCLPELDIKNSLDMCIRVLMYYQSNLSQADVKHVYLKNARKLRPDLGGK